MPKLDLTVCSLALNEEKNLKKCLESVKDWVREIIVVVDADSRDKTAEVAKKFTDKVLVKPHKDNFHENKQIAIDKATSKWVLWLDADEKVSQQLAEEIAMVLKKPEAEGYHMPRKNVMFGKWIKHTGWYPDWQLRLFKQGKGKYPCKKIHENPKVEGKIEKLKQPIVHYNYQNVGQYVEKLNRYTALDAKNLAKELKGKPLFLPLITRPINEFIKRFLAWEGYKDGFHGLVMSLLQAFYELVVVIKVWEMREFDEQKLESISRIEKEVKKTFKDWQWWKRESVIREARVLKRVFYKALRRFGL